MPKRATSGSFKKGRTKTGGRAPGTPNRITRDVKAFFAWVVNDPDAQDAFHDVILARDKQTVAAFLGAAAHVIGRPKETVAVETTPNMAKVLTMAIQAAQEKAKGERDAK